MKVLLDTCVHGSVYDALNTAGYDCIWTGHWPQDPGDDEILSRAYQDGRVLVTLDKDFGELAIVYVRPHCGIVRLVNFASQQQVATCLHVLKTYGEELSKAAIITAEPGRFRIREGK